MSVDVLTEAVNPVWVVVPGQFPFVRLERVKRTVFRRYGSGSFGRAPGQVRRRSHAASTS